MNDVVVAEDLRKTYGDVCALDGVSLSVAPGEVFGLIGPNGAGKTTLVRALTGTTPVEGTVRLLGGAPTAVDRDRIGLLPQSFAPASRLTPRELLTHYGGLYDEATDPESVLEAVGLADAADTWYEKLSGGQRRRACVGVALVNDPDVLFLDEPTTGIDPAGRRRLWDLIDRLAAGGTTVVLTSHSMAEIERLADRVALLADGRLLELDRPGALIETHAGESRVVVATAGTPEGAEVGDGGPPTDDRNAAAGDRTLPEGLAAAAADAGFDVEATPEGFVFEDVAAEEIGSVVDVLVDRGIEYDSLAWRQPGLEDVYLELTGDSFGMHRAGPSVEPTDPEEGELR